MNSFEKKSSNQQIEKKRMEMQTIRHLFFHLFFSPVKQE
tara:strand:- start:1063 stop:1179 length:117 start_codon:yes stop_codon:yes gene_type:complete